MTPDQFAKKMGFIANNLDVFYNGAIDAALVEVDSEISERIYNSNEGTEGQSFGSYKSDVYKEFRGALGLDTSTKNLQLTDQMRLTTHIDFEKKEVRLSEARDTETPELIVSYRLSKQKTARPIKTPKAITYAEKARFLEEQMGMKIFSASEEEKNNAMATLEDVFIEGIAEYLDAV